MSTTPELDNDTTTSVDSVLADATIECQTCASAGVKGEHKDQPTVVCPDCEEILVWFNYR